MTNDKQQKLLEIARSLIGTPYKYAVPAEEIPKFLDCSSFTQYVYKQIEIDLPRSTITQATIGKEISVDSQLEIGDLLFFRSDKGHYNDALFDGRKIYIGHAAMYSGKGKAIHSAGRDTHNMVVEENIESIASEERGPIVMIKRIL